MFTLVWSPGGITCLDLSLYVTRKRLHDEQLLLPICKWLLVPTRLCLAYSLVSDTGLDRIIENMEENCFTIKLKLLY